MRLFLPLLLGLCIASALRAEPLELPERAGPRPATSQAPPGTNIAHQQLDQLAPPALQERLLAAVRELPGVVVGRSLVSVPGARAFHLDESVVPVDRSACMVATELGHLHPPSDGSLHLRLPAELSARAVARGWAERHPRNPAVVMVYGPRDRAELEVVLRLVRAAHAEATRAPAD